MMRFSIIIPVHNGSKTIGDCLKAISDSKYKEYKVIVVAANSSDDTVKIAQKFPARIVQLETNPGAGASRNRGVKYAQGEIILFVDSDVIINDNALDLLVEDFKANPDIDAVQALYSDRCEFKNFTSVYSNLNYYYLGKKNKEENLSTMGTFFVAIRKEAFLKTGGFEEGLLGRTNIGEDQDFGYKFTHMGLKIHLDRQIMVEHRKYYSLVKYLLHDMQTGAQEAKSILENKNRVVSQAVKTGRVGVLIPVSFVASAALSILIFMGLLILIFFREPWVKIPLAVMAFLFYFLYFGFLSFCLKEKGCFFFVQSCLMSYLRMLCSFFGALKGLWGYAKALLSHGS